MDLASIPLPIIAAMDTPSASQPCLPTIFMAAGDLGKTLFYNHFIIVLYIEYLFQFLQGYPQTILFFIFISLQLNLIISLLPEYCCSCTSSDEYTAAEIHVCIPNSFLHICRPENLFVYCSQLTTEPQTVEGQSSKTKDCSSSQSTLS